MVEGRGLRVEGFGSGVKKMPRRGSPESGPASSGGPTRTPNPESRIPKPEILETGDLLPHSSRLRMDSVKTPQ